MVIPTISVTNLAAKRERERENVIFLLELNGQIHRGDKWKDNFENGIRHGGPK